MKLNKKNTKVKLDTKYLFIGNFALLVQYGLPIAYVTHTYGLLTWQNETYAFTGGAMISVAIAYFAFKNKIKSFITDYDTHLSQTAQRMKVGFGWLTAGLVIWFASIYLTAFLWLCVVLGGSALISYPLWLVYDKQNIEKRDLQKLLDERIKENKLSTLETLKKNNENL